MPRGRYTIRAHARETTFFDATDRPTHDRRGVHLTRDLYDEEARLIGEADFDERGRGVATKAGK